MTDEQKTTIGNRQWLKEGEMLQIIMQFTPKSNLIEEIELCDDHIKFSWRGIRFKVTNTLEIYEQHGKLWVQGAPAADLLLACYVGDSLNIRTEEAD
jgi:hypothetical protein